MLVAITSYVLYVRANIALTAHNGKRHPRVTYSECDGSHTNRVLCLEPRLLNVSSEELTMPGSQHLRGVSDKEQRQYEHIKQSAEKGGRYGDRAKEVAARTVMKEHKQKGHKKGR
jgi:hypothetical protein